MSPICGHPTSTRDGRPCQRTVAREGLRCPHHPRTVDVPDLRQAPDPDETVVIGEWPLAEAHAVVGGPVGPAQEDVALEDDE